MALRFFSSLAERVEAPCQVVAGGGGGRRGRRKGPHRASWLPGPTWWQVSGQVKNLVYQGPLVDDASWERGRGLD